MIIRKAIPTDLDSVIGIYDAIHTEEEAGRSTTGWKRAIYPVRETAEKALERDDLFVLENSGTIYGTALINQIQVDVYEGAPWKNDAPPEQVCVLHTLVISPDAKGKGYGTAFVRFYEQYAVEHGWTELRIDTNERNRAARSLYARLGYEEISIIPTIFNGIPGINLVLLEKTMR